MRNLIFASFALLLLALSAGCDPEQEQDTRCQVMARVQCSCPDGDAQRVARCEVYTEQLCAGDPSAAHWGTECESALSDLECPLDGPYPAVCSAQ